MKKVLVVAAHCDDEILGLGGTLVKYVPKRIYIQDISILILGEEYSDGLRKRCIEALNVLDIKDIHFENFNDNKFDEYPLIEVVQAIEGHINYLQPDIIFTHHHNDLNIDHRITYQAVLTACRPQPGFKYPDIYSFEVPSSTEWQYPNTFHPNYFVNITDTIDKKLEALKCYTEEMKPYPHARSLEGVRTMAAEWGRKIGVPYAEAFELIRKIR